MCRKKPIGFANPALAQLGGERDQVVVVHPDDVVSAQHRLQQAGEAPVCRRRTARRSRPRTARGRGGCGTPATAPSWRSQGSNRRNRCPRAERWRCVPLRSTTSTSPAGLTSPFQPNHRALRVRTMLARTTATPPARAALLRSSTRLETRTTRLIFLCALVLLQRPREPAPVDRNAEDAGSSSLAWTAFSLRSCRHRSRVCCR